MDRERALADALADFVDRRARGETLPLDEYCGRYPAFAAELRLQLEALEGLETLSAAGPAAVSPTAEPLPDRLSGHRIVRELGSGGMGRVLLAMDDRLGRQVAIKTLKPCYRDNASLGERFLNEARAMARISHPNVVHIYNLGEPGEEPHFVMEYLDGVPLTEAARPLPLRQKIELLHKAVMAVESLHRQQILHRDLKPANILVGADLEPKLLDFGLALRVEDRRRLTLDGQVVGTPNYFSPEQARGEQALDERSDVFALGIILYELLTGGLPFHSGDYSNPVLPRRLNPSTPGPLQNICLKALEARAEDRYRSARELAADLERYLAGEPVLAAPTSYTRLMAGQIDQHTREIDAWRRDHIVTESEYDTLRRGYERLVEREDAWILETRRLSLAQVSLYLGAWLLVAASALVVFFGYSGLHGVPAVLAIGGAAAATAFVGIRLWRRAELRVSVAWLLAFCLLLPAALLVALSEAGLAAQAVEKRELFRALAEPLGVKSITNAQIWWALLAALPAYLWLRRFTRSSVFSLVLATMGAAFAMVTLLRLGLLEWLEADPGKLYFHLIPLALVFFAGAMALEHRGLGADSRYFYPFAVAFTFIAFSGVASFHEPYRQWLAAAAPWTRGQIEYLFILNAGLYLLLQTAAERYPSPQMRAVAKAFRFVLPGHVMTSLLLLGVSASREAGRRGEARLFEVLLPVVACAFIFSSIPKQMKNFFVSGLLFLAIGVTRLSNDLFRHQGAWPLFLLAAGLLLMWAAANYASLKMAALRARAQFFRQWGR